MKLRDIFIGMIFAGLLLLVLSYAVTVVECRGHGVPVVGIFRIVCLETKEYKP